MHKLRESTHLKTSIKEDVTDALLDQLQDMKARIKERQSHGFTVGVVHLTGDLMHSSHIQYMNTIKRKMEDKYGWRVKLAVGVETDTRTAIRKQKENINSEQERKYMFENLKSVDKCYLEFSDVTVGKNEEKPSGIMKYLGADTFITHEEYIPDLGAYLQIARRYKEATGGQTMVIGDKDIEVTGEENMRYEFQSSTTAKIRKIFSFYKDNEKYNPT